MLTLPTTPRRFGSTTYGTPRRHRCWLSVHPKIAQERLGHSQISLTLGTYNHVLPGNHMSIISKCRRRAAVPQAVLDDVDQVTLVRQVGGVTVPEIVEAT